MGGNKGDVIKSLSKLSEEKLSEFDSKKDNLRYIFNKLCIEYGKNKSIFKDGKIIMSRIEKNNGNFKRVTNEIQLEVKENCGFYKNYIDCVNQYCKICNLSLINIKHITNKNNSGLIIGLGNPNVLEISMTIHHIYGVLYIPAQALKGTLRNYFLERYYDVEKQKLSKINELKCEHDTEEIYKYIFGDDLNANDNKKGKVIFFDTFPKGKLILKRDVMTPHYISYYENGKAPSGTEKPVPIFFYTVVNAKFDFKIALKNDNNINQNNIKGFISDFLKEALAEHGVGAKTSVGYGYIK